MKAHVTLFLLLMVVVAITLTSCDDRESSKPTLYFSVDEDSLYSGSDNHKTCDLTFSLQGESAIIAEKTIWVDYNPAFGQLFSTDNTGYVITDENGNAEASFMVFDGVYGDVQITARVNGYTDVTKTITLHVTELPTIDIDIVGTQFVANGTTEYPVIIQLTTHSTEMLANQEVMITSDLGLSGEFTSNSAGRIGTMFTAPSVADVYFIRAALADFPEMNERVTITFVSPE